MKRTSTSIKSKLKKIKIINGKFVWFDGNGKCFIGETDDAYYVANWFGS